MQILVNTDRHIDGTDEVEAVVQKSLSRYEDRITRVEVFFRDENSGEKFGDDDKRCIIEARLAGLQPITVSHQGSSLERALGGAADKLQKTLKRTLGRKITLAQRRFRGRDELAAASPVLQHDVETGKQEDFIRVFRPLLGYLVQHGHRELRILEASGLLHPGQLVLNELLDEVVTRAWLQFADRPPQMELDLWLTKLFDQLLEEQSQGSHARRAPRHTAVAPPEGQPQVGEQQWWAWLLEGGAPSPDSEIPSRQRAWAEEYLEVEELMSRIHSILGELPHVQRQAFVLHVLEAYDLPEIVMVQNRPEQQVRSDIEAARAHLRGRLNPGAGSQAPVDPPTGGPRTSAGAT